MQTRLHVKHKLMPLMALFELEIKLRRHIASPCTLVSDLFDLFANEDFAMKIEDLI